MDLVIAAAHPGLGLNQTGPRGMDLNSTSMPERNQHDTKIYIIIPIFFSIIAVCGTIANIIVIVGITCSRPLWRPSYFYLLNSSTADLVLCSVYCTYTAYKGFTYGDNIRGQWPFSIYNVLGSKNFHRYIYSPVGLFLLRVFKQMENLQQVYPSAIGLLLI